ncbi:leukotriene C4 synthase isoform X4 [Callithrix jacchus]
MKDEVALLATVTLLGVLLQGAAALCGLIYLFARLRYFQGYARSAHLRGGAFSRHRPADRRPQAGPAVRERARPLAAGGAGCPRPALPLPPGGAMRRAPRTAPDAAAVGLRPRPQESGKKSRSLQPTLGGALASAF